MTITYGRLTLVKDRVGRSSDGHILSRWQCECGNQVDVARSRVKCGATQSCGCLMIASVAAANTRHGGRRTPEYSSWQAMRRRCNNPGDKDYARYGARGISVYPEWNESFAAFRDALGPRPSGHTLDRIDANGNYAPGNVRWAPAKVQGRNRRKTYIWHIKGRVFGSITEAAEAFGVSEHSVHRWVKGQFDKRRNTMTPPREDCRVEERY